MVQGATISRFVRLGRSKSVEKQVVVLFSRLISRKLTPWKLGGGHLGAILHVKLPIFVKLGGII